MVSNSIKINKTIATCTSHLKSLNPTMTYDDGNPGGGLTQAQKIC